MISLFSQYLIFVLVLSLNLDASNCEKTYSEDELAPFFQTDATDKSACDVVEQFFANKSVPFGSCIRYKQKVSKDPVRDPTMYCLGKNDIFRNFSFKWRFEKIETLIICQFNNSAEESDEFDLNSLKYFTRLKDLLIEKTSFTSFTHKFPKLDNLRYINISKTKLRSIKSDFFINLPSIQIIDLSFNEINVIEKLVFSSSIQSISLKSDAERPVKLFLRSNLFDCTKHLKWMALKDSKFEIIDRNDLKCSNEKYRARPLLTVMNYKLMLHKICHEEEELKNCSCHISYLRLNDQANEYHPMYSVNCSYAGFKTFPKKLPENTTTLFITHNNITSLEGLCNGNLKEVHDIYADHNQIRTVASLEKCDWFNSFRVLSLRGNLLEKIPVYVFRNNLEKNLNAMKIFLSDNPWLCSCQFGHRLLSLSLEHDTVIDKDQIVCLSEQNDPDVYGSNLLELSRNEMCQVNDVPLDIFEILSIVFGALIVLLMVNLVWDYYNYKTYGKLPWIVIKAPFL